MRAFAQAYPLDLLRTRLAAQTTGNYYNGIRGSLATIVRDEGMSGLYRGLGATLIQVLPVLVPVPGIVAGPCLHSKLRRCRLAA